jgi:hypothetical protein
VSKEGIFVATRHFEHASLGAIPEPLLPLNLLMSGFAAPLRLLRPQQSEDAVREKAWYAEEEVETSNIGRCIRWAFAIEAGAVLVVFVVWAGWRLLF